MSKTLKYTLYGLVVLFGLLIIALVAIAATFNPNDYKPRLIQLVHDKTQRTLSIPGDIKLTFFPRIGADLGVVSLSERRKPEVFASATHSHVAVALLPLLSRQVVVDRVLLDGLTVNLHRYKNNSTNYDDLTSKAGDVTVTPATPKPDSPQEKAKAVLLDLGGIAVTDAHLNYTDDTQGSKLSAHLAKLITGPIATGKKSRLELEADLATSPGNFKLIAKLNSALAVNMESWQFELNDLSTDLSLPNPAGGSIAISASGKVAIDLDHEQVQATLNGKMDSTTFDAKIGLHRFAQPAYSFDITLGDLDADRYLAADKPAASGSAASARGAGGASGAASADAAVDLSALKTLNAKGSFKMAALKVAGIRSTEIKLDVRAAGGKLDATPLSAMLYGGAVSGALSAAAGSPQRVAAKLSLRNIQIGPLLKDAMDKDPLDGKGDVTLDVASTGATVNQFKKALNGTASMALKDGSVKGFNIAAALRHSSGDQKTDFTELTASFKIANGIAHNDDLAAKTPLFRLGGSGDINIGDSNLDYTAKATVVPTLEGQGGPELQSLKGLTIPVRLSGPFTQIAWKIEPGNVAGNRAKELADERSNQLKAEAQKRLDAEKAKLQDRLKGLLGR